MLYKKTWFFLTIVLFCFFVPLLSAQEILLDKIIKAGPLTCFQSFDEPNVYYYLPDHPRLSVHENGKPQFSFLKYVRNVKGKGEGGITDAEGGGIVHFLVEYGATKEDIRAAERALQQQVPGAKIKGPIMYNSGHFTLVSSFKEENGEFTKKIVGIGNAPLLEGHKAAISMNLTQKGAQVLWQSFQSATPDISILFEMVFSGYREPYEATLTADWSKISKHKSFAAKAKFLWFGAEIKKAFDELRQSGAVKLTTKGKNKDLDKIISTAYSRLQDIIFSQSPVTRATAARVSNPGSTIGRTIRAINRTVRTVKEIGRKKHAPPRKFTPQKSGMCVPGSLKDCIVLAGDIIYSDAGSLLYAASTPHKKSAKTRKRRQHFPSSTSHANKEKKLKRRNNKGKRGRQSYQPSGFALIASYRMKEIKRSGSFRLNFNQFLEVKQSVVMAENLGNLFARYGDDPTVFRAVNIDDPVFKQREILVFLDGQDSADFDKYINFVTVQLRKIHEDGEETIDEVVIRKENFNAAGNSFRLLYGWKGDDNREQWLNYQYRTDWSFHGDMKQKGNWQKNNQPMISASPPYEYRRLILEAEPEVFRERGVRHATIKIFYPLLGKEKVKQATIKTRQKSFSIPFDYIHSRGELNYAYEISWHLKGGKTISSGRQQGTEDVLYCDELPIVQ